MMKIVAALFFTLMVFGAMAQSEETAETFESGKEWAEAVKKEITQISTEDFHQLYSDALQSGNPRFVLIDIRTRDEYDEGFIPGAFLIQRGVLEFSINSEDYWEEANQDIPPRDQKIILYCRSGNRSALGTKSLMMMGYTNVMSLEGGWKAWNKSYPNLKKVN